MPKNIVLCCENQSNLYTGDVTKLYQCLRRGENQIVFFYPALSMRIASQVPSAWIKMKEILFGTGLFDELRAAYLFLMTNYEPGDRLFFFGAGRGAYAVRALAGILHLAGLLERGNEMLVPHAIYLAGRLDNRTFFQARQLKSTFSRDCPIHFVGIWDSPAKFGWVFNPFPLRMPFSTNNPSIRVGRHALAIDERRTLFAPSLWQMQKDYRGPRDLKQVWFRGVHSDICGGYPEEESGLAVITFEWMLHEAMAQGLEFDPEAVARCLYLGDANEDSRPKAVLHNSMVPHLALFEFLPTRVYDATKDVWSWKLNLRRPRHIPPGSLIHQSVLERDPLPGNLPEQYIVENAEFTPGEPSL